MAKINQRLWNVCQYSYDMKKPRKANKKCEHTKNAITLHSLLNWPVQIIDSFRK